MKKCAISLEASAIFATCLDMTWHMRILVSQPLRSNGFNLEAAIFATCGDRCARPYKVQMRKVRSSRGHREVIVGSS